MMWTQLLRKTSFFVRMFYFVQWWTNKLPNAEVFLDIQENPYHLSPQPSVVAVRLVQEHVCPFLGLWKTVHIKNLIPMSTDSEVLAAAPPI